MPPPRMSTNPHRKQRLRQALQTGKPDGSTHACVVRVIAFAARTALVVFLLRSVLLQDFFFSSGEDAAVVAAAASKKPSDAPKKATAPPPIKTTPSPVTQAPTAPVTSLRIFEWKNGGEDSLKFSKDTQIPPFKHILMLGDSTMSKLVGTLFGPWGEIFPNHGLPQKGWPCSHVGYMKLKPGNWVRPNFGLGEGPATQTRAHCSEQQDVKSGRLEAGFGKPFAVEYIVVEYARDVSNPTPTTKTTQETVELYLKSRISNSRLCAINNGLYDMLIPGITKELYVKNLQEYLHKMVPHCQTIVWISMGGTQTSKPPPRTNAQIIEWNAATKEMLAKDPILMPKTVYLDVFQASLNFQHVDPIHMTSAWYLPLSKLFSAPVAETAKH